MSSKKSNIYVRKRSKDGEEILCPIDDSSDTITNASDDFEDCVEQDVVGRYAGKIEIRSASETEKRL
jgi:hypothetical protein